jgi:hypothetical protein
MSPVVVEWGLGNLPQPMLLWHGFCDAASTFGES